MKISSYQFEGPYDPDRGFKIRISAIYALIDDTPKLLDVGQTDDLNNRFPSHPRKNCWHAHARGRIHLYILREENEQNRLLIEKNIRVLYNPPCGDK